MVEACSETEQSSRTGAIIRRAAVYTGISLLAVGAATLLVASPAEAAEIDYDEATSAEIEDHLEELRIEREGAADALDGLEQRLADAQAVIDEAAAIYGSTDSQLTNATTAVDSAAEDLGARMSTLVGFAREQSERFTETQAATAEADGLEVRIDEVEAEISGLDEQIEEAEERAKAAAEAEAQAEAEAAAAAEAEAAAAEESEEPAASSDSSNSTASYSSDAATAAVQFARDQLGEAYVYGSAGPDTWDCSGLVMQAYAVSGISLTHQTNAMWAETSAIGRSDLKPGDLVFYAGLGHMAMYLGGGEVIHAPSSGDVVKISSIDMMGIDGYRRV